MDAIECIKTRRSIRKFEPRPVPRELLMELVDCARHSPSSRNQQSWQFVVVTDQKQKALLDSLRTTMPCHWMMDAPALIGVCSDLSKSKRWIEDGSIAATTILLAAHALGLGACWIAMRFEDTALNARIQKALGVSGSVFPICLIALGYPAEEPAPRELRRLHDVVR